MKAGSVQDLFLGVEAIEGGCLRLLDGSLRGVLAVGSVNFAMLSAGEQRALVGGYAQFLLTLKYPLQLAIPIETKDLSPYLARLEDRARQEPSPLLRELLWDHIADLRLQARDRNLLDRRFFLAVPAGEDAAVTRRGPFAAFLHQRGGGRAGSARRDLDFRLEEVAGRLKRWCGLPSERLGTEELVQLLHAWLARDLVSRQRLRAPGEYAGLFVTGSVPVETLPRGLAGEPPPGSPAAPDGRPAAFAEAAPPPQASDHPPVPPAPGGTGAIPRPARAGRPAADELGRGRPLRPAAGAARPNGQA